MASSVKKKIVLIVIVLGPVLLVGLGGYVQLRKGNVVQDVTEERQEEVSTPEQVPSRPSPKRVIGEIIRTETAQCNGEIYIFEMVLTEDQRSYFNNIYRNIPSTENFVTSIKAPPRGGNTFYFLAAPQENCDRIYLTVALYESDAPLAGIFEWRIGAQEVHELATGKDFLQNHLPYPFREKSWLSPDGEAIIFARQTEPTRANFWCDHRTLRLIHLREDVSETLVGLPKGETFDNGNSDLAPYCQGLKFGWENEKTIYYDVYDATTDPPRSRLGRKTLSIP